MIQITVLKIVDYGPWTLTLGSDREHKLQMLQALLYHEIQDQFSKRDSLVFLNRHDEFFAASNKLAVADHSAIQDHLQSKFEVRVDMSLGAAKTPYGANLAAAAAKRSSTYADRRRLIFGVPAPQQPSEVTILHMDVEDLGSYRKTKSPYEITSGMADLYSKMSSFFIRYDSMAFFLGGDNFMVLSTDNPRSHIQEFLDTVQNQDGTTLNCGMGRAETSRAAACLATKSLDKIRQIRDSGGNKPQIYEMP